MSDAMSYSVFLADEADTLALGRLLSTHLAAPFVFWLEGDLGAGKTTLVRGLLRGLGYEGVVKSPTYTLVESYPFADFTIQHFDLYRFQTPDEWLDAGLDELLGADNVAFIEWPQQAAGFVSAADVCIRWQSDLSGRTVRFTVCSEAGHRLLTSLTESS